MQGRGLFGRVRFSGERRPGGDRRAGCRADAGGRRACAPGGEVWRLAALRAVGSLSVASFFAVAALWVFFLRGSAWQWLLPFSLAGFLMSWISAVREAGRPPGRGSGAGISQAWSGLSRVLVRHGFFAGFLVFVAFFLLSYRQG